MKSGERGGESQCHYEVTCIEIRVNSFLEGIVWTDRMSRI